MPPGIEYPSSMPLVSIQTPSGVFAVPQFVAQRLAQQASQPLVSDPNALVKALAALPPPKPIAPLNDIHMQHRMDVGGAPLPMTGAVAAPIPSRSEPLPLVDERGVPLPTRSLGMLAGPISTHYDIPAQTNSPAAVPSLIAQAVLRGR